MIKDITETPNELKVCIVTDIIKQLTGGNVPEGINLALNVATIMMAVGLKQDRDPKLFLEGFHKEFEEKFLGQVAKCRAIDEEDSLAKNDPGAFVRGKLNNE